MPPKKRFKTKYPGVYYIEGISVGSGKRERIYYIRYRRGGKEFDEKCGRQFQDDMTPAKAARIRVEKIDGKKQSNTEKRHEIRDQKEEEQKKWTIDRLWEEYKTHHADSKSLRTDDNRYQNYVKSKFGNMEPGDLIQLEIDRFRINLQKKIKPQTVKHTLAMLKRIINFGVNRNLCTDPGFRIRMPKVNNLKTEDLTPDQLSNLFEAIEKDSHPHAGSMMKMTLYTGMRRGELFKLKWEHIDFERGFISIVDPKGGPDQKIPLNDMARSLLESHVKLDSPFVFPGRGGRQRTDINKHVNKIKKQAGLPKDFRPLHGLRHVYASMLASSGKVDMYTLQKLLTHKSPLMTQRYAHLRDETLKRASDLAGDLIGEIVNEKRKSKKINGSYD